MASALASQLAGIRSVNAARIATLGSSAGTQHTASYLFPPKTAAAQDLNTVHALARTGLEDLAAHDRWFESSSAWAPDDVSRSGRELLFGDSGKSRDRSVLTKEDNTLMDEALALFLAASLMVIAALGACFPFSSEAVRATIGSLGGQVETTTLRLTGHSPSPTQRVLAIRNLYEALSAGALPASDSFAVNALQSRMSGVSEEDADVPGAFMPIPVK
ncbi:unnamed protein product [Tilletia caries]|nr:unnamed protein product [Tilletia caries]